MAEEQSMGLRERKKVDTRRALSDAALELAFERGLDQVRREDIAARAGVSIRTFNNYFTSKYEALAYRQIERVRRSVEMLGERPADEPLWTAITTAFTAPMEAEARDIGLPVPSRAQLDVVRTMTEAPELRAEMMKSTAGETDELVEVIARRTGTNPEFDLYPRLVAAAIEAALQASSEAYVRADRPAPITEFLRRSFAELTAGLPDPSVK